LVALENYSGWPGESNWSKSEELRTCMTYAVFLSFLPMIPPEREYNTISAIADEIWQYRTGGNLTIFNKDHDTAEEGRSRTALGSCSQAYGFATITMYSRWQPSEIGCAYRM
jgi:hypothetical protein